MRRQELGPRKRLKRARDGGEDSLRRFDSPASGEDPPEGLTALDEGEESQNSAPEISERSGEEDAIPSRFSFKPPLGFIGRKAATPHASSLPPTFAEMGVSSSLVSAMNKMSIHTPTEVQATCIPPLLTGM